MTHAEISPLVDRILMADATHLEEMRAEVRRWLHGHPEDELELAQAMEGLELLAAAAGRRIGG